MYREGRRRGIPGAWKASDLLPTLSSGSISFCRCSPSDSCIYLQYLSSWGQYRHLFGIFLPQKKVHKSEFCWGLWKKEKVRLAWEKGICSKQEWATCKTGEDTHGLSQILCVRQRQTHRWPKSNPIRKTCKIKQEVNGAWENTSINSDYITRGKDEVPACFEQQPQGDTN